MQVDTLQRIGRGLLLASTAIILGWVGLFKFTPTEAEAIRPFAENSPLMSWMYSVFRVQVVSNIIGVIEVATALVLLASIWVPRLKQVAGVLIVITFITTLTFLFSTPDTFKWVDGFPVTNFFVLKDLSYLGYGFLLLSWRE